jgi:hypothetical protein
MAGMVLESGPWPLRIAPADPLAVRPAIALRFAAEAGRRLIAACDGTGGLSADE